jgi:hypothetical protein
LQGWAGARDELTRAALLPTLTAAAIFGPSPARGAAAG